MDAKKLMNPRYELIADYPSNQDEIGTIVECPNFDKDFSKDYWCQIRDKYPHLFRKLNWWEQRNIEDMPKRLICKAIPNDPDIMEIQEWDMDLLVGWINKSERECCSLRSFNPEYGYFPVD